MGSKHFFQILILLALLFSPLGGNQPVRASADLQDQPVASVVVSPDNIAIGETATVTISLENVPAEGYTSVELTCTYASNLVEASDILAADRFGPDPVAAINQPYPYRFIAAIAGNHGNKATTDGALLSFKVRGLQPGPALIECQTRVSRGDNTLTVIETHGSQVVVLGSTLTPTIDPTPCDRVQMVADITVPDGTVFAPGASFMKTWRLKNAGSCAWTSTYQLVFYSGEQMGGPSSAYFFRTIAPGQSVDITINLTAPLTPGSYRGYWMFKNANGQLFGTGPAANQPWWVDIRVPGATLTATPTLSPTACDKAELIGDAHVLPGPVMMPGAQFTTQWFLKNVGTCTWTTSYRLAFYSGEQMGAFSSAPLPVSVAPGQVIVFAVTMIAPSTAGSYRGYWIFQNDTGKPFGVGSLGNQPWFVDIVVSNVTPTLTDTPSVTPDEPANSPTPTGTPGMPTNSLTPSPTSAPTATALPGTYFDFVAQAYVATWYSGAGQLPYPGIDGNPNGFAFKVDNPRLETGAIDTRPGLLTVPQNVQNGYIQGFYPPIRVQSGDRFRSMIACEGGATNCYVAFRLDYQTGTDPIRTLWGPFLERYEGQIFSVDVDLSPLAGKDVKFILTVLAAGMATGDRALWVGPRIYRPDAVVPTSTFDASLTPTATPTYEPPTPAITSAPFESPTPTPAVTGIIAGRVLAGKQVTIDLFDAGNWPVGVAFTNADGTFSLTAPAGTYNIVARAPGFLSAMGPVTVTLGSTATKPTIALLAGDLDGNFVIDQFDVMTIGMNYNGLFPAAADLNNDNIINVLDLELLAKNYRTTGPVPWP